MSKSIAEDVQLRSSTALIIEDGTPKLVGSFAPLASMSGSGVSRHPNSARFHSILKELGELHDRKQLDYGKGNDPFANIRGSAEWGIPAWVGAMVRANDKIKRLQTFAVKGSLANEGAIDSFNDLAVYAVIGRVLFEDGTNGQL